MIVKDPVCGKQVDHNKAPASSYQGQKYSFCGQDCKNKFDHQPERYAGFAQPHQHEHAERK